MNLDDEVQPNIEEMDEAVVLPYASLMSNDEYVQYFYKQDIDRPYSYVTWSSPCTKGVNQSIESRKKKRASDSNANYQSTVTDQSEY